MARDGRAGPPRVEGFPPVAREDAEILVLGTMPGPASLARGEYYGHPRNAFWPIIAMLFDLPLDAPYGQRLAALTARRIALWDVLAACTREGAADAAIRDPAANDFASFFVAHRRIRRLCFNGGGAARLFARHVDRALLPTGIEFRQLPSTSPAFAVMAFADKLAGWRAGLASAYGQPVQPSVRACRKIA
jgi:TDG/mug DNA glycosylase family protein